MSNRLGPNVHDACQDGNHELTFDCAGVHVRVCEHCGISSQTLTDFCGHEQWWVGSSDE
jgi:hypothetical protein